MNLDETQKKTVAGWIKEGVKLSDIQKRIESEFGIRMTYMDVRFLVDDLKVMPKDQERPAVPAVATSSLAQKTPPAASPAAAPDGSALGGGLSLTVDSVTRPGAMVSGSVRFSDGNNATWYIDQTGRLGIAPAVQGYKPSAQDLQAFQTELQNELQRLGF